VCVCVCVCVRVYVPALRLFILLKRLKITENLFEGLRLVVILCKCRGACLCSGLV